MDIPVGAIPVDQFEPAVNPQQTAEAIPEGAIPIDKFESEDAQQEKFGTGEQRAKTFAESAAKGVLGPLALLAEKKLLHVRGSDILAREQANPWTSAGGQVTGLGASLFTGVGEGALAAKAGEAVQSGLGLSKAAEGASLATRLGGEAVNQAAQMSIIQGSDEIGKMILNDPDTTAQSAMAHIGMAAALGGVTGAAIGSISPLWKASVGEGLAKPLEDMKARWKFRQENPNVIESAHQELQNIHTNIDNVRSALFSEGEGGIRGESVANALPKETPEVTAKINEHIQKVSDDLSSQIEKMSENVKTKSGAKLLEQDLIDFQSAAANPDALIKDKFKAEDQLKRTLQAYSKYNTTAQDTEFGAMTKKLAAQLRVNLENPEIWGEAANVQKDINAAFHKFSLTEKDMISKFTSKLAGEKVIDAGKLNTYFNQLGKPSAEIKQAMMKNYLTKSEELINTVNKALTDRGLEPQFNHTSTNVLSDSIGKKTHGAQLVDTLIDKELDKVAGKVAGGSIGSSLGAMVGHPGIGFLLGEHTLGPMFSSVMSGLTKSITESPTLAKGFKSAIDFATAAAKGQKVFNNAAMNVFKPGAQVLGEHLIPTSKDREKLDKVVTDFQEHPEKLLKVDNGHVDHYLPGHQIAISQTSAQAVQYLQSLKPQPHILGPLDKPVPPQPVEIARYNRALDIAQSPAIVFQHIKTGTLQASDIADLHNIYPALYQQMQQKLTNQMTSRHADDEPIPYKTRLSMALFLGFPVDVSMQPSSIMAAQPMPKGPPQQPQGKKLSDKSMNSLRKGAKSYQTPNQQAESDRSNRD